MGWGSKLWGGVPSCGMGILDCGLVFLDCGWGSRLWVGVPSCGVGVLSCGMGGF